MTEPTIHAERIPWHDPRLGRHIEHDERSWQHDAATILAALPIRNVLWRRYSAILNQGNLGSCTGNAMAAWLACEPNCPDESVGARYDEQLAVDLYALATRLDPFPGTYPPEDTGSSGNAVAKAARQMRMIRSWGWCFTTSGLIRALMHGPVIVGVPWYESMFDPDSDGTVIATGDIAGGHEFLVRGWDNDRALFLCDNSWGARWGVRGSFAFTRDTWNVLRANRADVTVPRM